MATDDDWNELTLLLDELVEADPAFSAQVAVYRAGRPVFDATVGLRAAPSSITGVFSVGKGIAAICVATLVQDGLLDLDSTVATYWPEFAANGKADITVRQLLSHQAGLVGLPGGFSTAELSGASPVDGRLAAAATAWRPGKLHGYHAVTIGFFAEEVVSRVTGTSLQAYYDSRIRDVLGLDTYLGVPADQEHRYVPLLDQVVTAEDRALIEAGPDPRDLLSFTAYNLNGPLSPNGFAGELTPNIASIRAHGNPGFAGVSNARGLARLYAATITPVDGTRLLTDDTITQVAQTQVYGFDQVTRTITSFAIGFMKPCPDFDYGSAQAFGHYGAAGAYGYADPAIDLAVGFVPYYAARYPGGPDARALSINALVRRIARRAED